MKYRTLKWWSWKDHTHSAGEEFDADLPPELVDHLTAGGFIEAQPEPVRAEAPAAAPPAAGGK